MKKLLTLAALAGMLAAQQTFALTVDVNRTPGAGVAPGGEFTVTSVSPDPAFDAILSKYSANAIVNGGFQTFCLSLTTELLGNPQVGTLDPSGVSAGTAFLYSGFAAGNLSGYNYSPFGTVREASAVQLQAAIWYLEGFTQAQINAAYGSSVFDPTSDTFVLAAISHFGSLTDALLDNNGGFGVDTLRLSQGDSRSQPMLALVPDGASTILLLGFALSGLGVVSRKLRA